jgi:hypothetical protein
MIEPTGMVEVCGIRSSRSRLCSDKLQVYEALVFWEFDRGHPQGAAQANCKSLTWL